MKIRSDQRQHLRISRFAYEQLIEDAIMFGDDSVLRQGTSSKGIPEVSESGMINRIFLNYYDIAEASISIAAENKRTYFRNVIAKQRYAENNPWDEGLDGYESNQTVNAEGNQIIDLLVRAEIEKTLEIINHYPKEITLKIRLQNETNDLLYPYEDDYPIEERTISPWDEQQYYKSRGDYIAAVIEEYARKTRYEREHIFFVEMIEKIDQLCKGVVGKRIVTIDYLTAAGDVIKSDVKPYRITNASESEHHYLIGLSRQSGMNNNAYSIGLFRLDRIIKIRIRPKSFGSGKITKAEKELLENEIEAKGILFLLEPNEKTIVSLTSEGVRKYNNQWHLRPTMIKMDPPRGGKRNAYFDCTPSQIRYYFFEFGKDAVVISPIFLQKEFKEKYKQAEEEYNL